MRHDRRISSQRRRGFSLTEILVVIAIIGVLASLAAVGTIAMIGNRQARNTEATMKVVNKLLQDRWSSVIADAKKETPSAAAVVLAKGANPLVDRDPTGERAKVIMVKVRLMEAFPVTYSEVLTPTVVNTFVSQHKSYFAKYQTTITAGMMTGAPGESSACLLMALKALQGSGVAVDDQLKYAVANSDGKNPINVLIDGWSKPMSFYRFPWNNANLRAANPATATNSRSAQFCDPTDPDGTLVNTTWHGSPATYAANYPIMAFRNRTALQVFENSFHTIAMANSPGVANYTIPVIVSAGKDGKFGLKNMDATGNNDIFPLLQEMSIAPPPVPLPPGSPYDRDNIYSYQLRLD
jgi:prepilin-type N-terminal cleavage/methylation domain-containing protein